MKIHFLKIWIHLLIGLIVFQAVGRAQEFRYRVVSGRPVAAPAEKVKNVLQTDLLQKGVPDWTLLYRKFSSVYAISGFKGTNESKIEFHARFKDHDPWSLGVPMALDQFQVLSEYLKYFVSLSSKGRVDSPLENEAPADSGLYVCLGNAVVNLPLSPKGSRNGTIVQIFSALMEQSFEPSIKHTGLSDVYLKELKATHEQAEDILKEGLDFVIWLPDKTAPVDEFLYPRINSKVDQIIGSE